MRCTLLKLLSALLVTASACSNGRTRSLGWADTSAQAVVGAEDKVDSLRVNVYVDGTVSMSGFLAGGSSRYTGFLDGVESALQNGLRRADVHYFKFGRVVRELDRAGFRAARTPSFYAEHGISDVTQIDSVIQCDSGAQVTVAVTDLFQDEGDVQSIVSRIKNRCFAKGAAVGILAIPSEFNGMVYDAVVPPYPYSSTGDAATYRPFYAVMLGAPEHLERIHDALRAANVHQGDFVLISPHVVRQFEVKMTKSRDSRDLNRRAEAAPGHFRFDVRRGGAGGTAIADIMIRLKPSAPDFRAERLGLTALRRGAGSDSVQTADFTLERVQRTAAGVTATLSLHAPSEPGNYAYQLSLVTDPLDGFLMPAWVARLSSPNPTAQADPNKTLNLETFVTDLRHAASSVHPPELARWYVDLRRL
ncbi:MAG TPA: hypothetical protein VGO40_07525 [Longimicrobium sp.]|jgi:hypothetical protein|nr:hypothetical protein [Longimicrobium sp.]